MTGERTVIPMSSSTRPSRVGEVLLRRPVLSSLVWFLLLLSITDSFLLVGADAPDRAWASALAVVVIAGGAGPVYWIQRNTAGLPPSRLAALLSALGTAPYLLTGALVMVGAASWVLWIALTAVAIHLGWMVWFLRRIGEPPNEV